MKTEYPRQLQLSNQKLSRWASKMNIPGYQIQRELDSGGMSTVYLAQQQLLERMVALKVIKPSLLADHTFAERFIEEARILAKLSHPNILNVYDYGEAEELCYMAMEYIPGGNLQQKISQGLSRNSVIAITKQLLSALDHIHQQGYVHRDVKPENVLFRSDGSIVFTDYGIAKGTKQDSKLTQVGMCVGTPHYMSPEQAKGEEVDGRSDFYSLGIVIYEMLTGTVPFDAEDSFAIAYKHINSKAPILPKEKSEFQHLLDKLLEKRREDRFATASEIEYTVDLIQSGGKSNRKNEIQKMQKPQSADSLHQLRKQLSKKVTLVFVVLILCGLVMGISFLLIGKRSPDIPLVGGGKTPVATVTATDASLLSAIQNHTTDNSKQQFNLYSGKGTTVLEKVLDSTARSDETISNNRSASTRQADSEKNETLISLKKNNSTEEQQNNSEIRESEKLQENLLNQQIEKGLDSYDASTKINQINQALVNSHEIEEQDLEKRTSLKPKHAQPKLENKSSGVMQDLAKNNKSGKAGSQRALLSEYDDVLPHSSKNKYMINDLLASAKIAFNEDRLTKPPNDNAFFFYTRVLKLQPRHKGATEGIKMIATRYLALSSKLIDKNGNLDNASEFLRKAEEIDPGLKEIGNIRKKLQEKRHNRENRIAIAPQDDTAQSTPPEGSNLYLRSSEQSASKKSNLIFKAKQDLYNNLIEQGEKALENNMKKTALTRFKAALDIFPKGKEAQRGVRQSSIQE